MQKAPPSGMRLAVMVGFALSCFGLLLYLWLAFGGTVPLLAKGYRVTGSFDEATSLAVEADVRISGVPVGKVKSVLPNARTGRSDVEMEIDSDYAPLPADARAVLRQKTLLGETYVELTPGTRRAPPIPEGGRLAPGRVSPTVELDEIFRTFDPDTRRALQTYLQQQALAVGPHGRDLNDALGNLEPFAEEAAEVVGILRRHDAAVRRLVADGGEVLAALTERRGQLAGMVQQLDRVFAATAARDRELQETVVALPTFERESRAALQRAADFADTAMPLVRRLRPAARQLSPTLIDLEALAPELPPLFRDVDALTAAARRGFPAARRVVDDLEPVLQQLDPALRQVVPALQFLGLYKRELGAFFGNVVAATQASDVVPGTNRRINYLRTTNPFNAENLAAFPRRIGSNRPLPYALPGAFDRLKDGLEVFEDRHCGRGVPYVSQVVAPALESVFPPELIDRINDTLRPTTEHTQQPAPPCRRQAPFDFGGERRTYPRVQPAP